MQHAFLHFQNFFQHYGLIAVFTVLLLENFGLPLPGELTLLYAGYHLRVHGGFGMAALIAVGSVASAAGQAIGFGVGRYGRGWALKVLPADSAHYRRLIAFFNRHGAVTIFFARFVAGMRVFAGLAAGLANMARRPFLIYNLLGAVVWVAALATTGSLLGGHWRRLLRLMGRVDALILALAAAAAVAAWLRLRRELR
ncbi:MAG: DedA family protein [Streptosporangiaceae bacterium]